MSDRIMSENWRRLANSPEIEDLVRQCVRTPMTPEATEDLIDQAHSDAAYFRDKRVFRGDPKK